MNFEGIHCFDTASVRFAFYPEGPAGPRVIAQISEETLRDEFGVREMGEGLLDACRRHFYVIEPTAIARYRAMPRALVTLTLEDFLQRRRTPTAAPAQVPLPAPTHAPKAAPAHKPRAALLHA